MTEATGWSDYWRKEGVGGEVFVGPENQRHAQLDEFWRRIFSTTPAGASVMDMACGAGSVFAALPDDHGLALHGSDVSPEALKLLAQRIPGVVCSESGATELAYPDQHFDKVVSQFGLEYAGADAFSEAARVLAPGGTIDLLCHCQGGYVDQRTSSQLKGALAARDSSFALKAAQLMRAMFAVETNTVKRVAGEFQRSEIKLRKTLETIPEGIHAHLYHGFRQMYANYKNYALTDILQWLSDVSSEIEMSVQRLSHMRDAMLDDAALADARARLQAAGVDVVEIVEVTLSEQEAPVAYHISGSRPAIGA